MRTGFTLLEVLVALLVLALVGAAALHTHIATLALEQAAHDMQALRLGMGQPSVASRESNRDWTGAPVDETNGPLRVTARRMPPPPEADANPRLHWTLTPGTRTARALDLFTTAAP